jgi:hypothetical protein
VTAVSDRFGSIKLLFAPTFLYGSRRRLCGVGGLPQEIGSNWQISGRWDRTCRSLPSEHGISDVLNSLKARPDRSCG